MSETLTLFTAVDLLTEVDPNMQYRMIEFLKQSPRVTGVWITWKTQSLVILTKELQKNKGKKEIDPSKYSQFWMHCEFPVVAENFIWPGNTLFLLIVWHL